MQDQDRRAEWAGEPAGSPGQRSLGVPAGIVDELRQAVFAKIGEAGEAINESAFAKDHTEHPEWFVLPTNDLVEMYELMEVIGWMATASPIDVQVDLWAHGRALLRTLQGTLEFAEADVSETMRRDAEKPGTARSAERDAEIDRIGVLRDFIAKAQARFDALERGDA
jgi:hypothetical protein